MKVLGYALIAAPFVCIIGFMLWDIGTRVTLVTLAITALASSCIIGGIFLVSHG